MKSTKADRVTATIRHPSSASKRKYRLVSAGAVLAVLVVIVVLILYYQDTWVDKSAQAGSLQGLTREQIIQELNKQVEEGSMSITMASTVVFRQGSGQGEANIQNLPSNRLDQKITIILDDTGETLYQSNAIPPGHYIQYINLSKELPPGTHAAKAVFEGYEQNTHERVGTAALEIEIVQE